MADNKGCRAKESHGKVCIWSSHASGLPSTKLSPLISSRNQKEHSKDRSCRSRTEPDDMHAHARFLLSIFIERMLAAGRLEQGGIVRSVRDRIGRQLGGSIPCWQLIEQGGSADPMELHAKTQGIKRSAARTEAADHAQKTCTLYADHLDERMLAAGAAVFDGVDVAGAGASRPRADNVGVRRNEEIDFDINWLLSDVEARNGNYSGERMLNVNLNLGLSEEASSPSIVLKEDPDCDSCSKRPKVNSFSLDWDNHLLQETSYLCPMNEGGGDVSLSNFLDATDDKGKDIGISKMEDLDVRMDLTDDLLHVVFTSIYIYILKE
ncbi:uncharacterized protein LOC107830693 [Nicotiana tabacum]|uniref:Uncharacterized protein LOC107830693 n=1 Tax=Nicotiana tabacum TaxID=4097 RepID=A0AC58RUH3_TOBAC